MRDGPFSEVLCQCFSVNEGIVCVRVFVGIWMCVCLYVISNEHVTKFAECTEHRISDISTDYSFDHKRNTPFADSILWSTSNVTLALFLPFAKNHAPPSPFFYCFLSRMCSNLGLIKEKPLKAVWSMESMRVLSQWDSLGFSLRNSLSKLLQSLGDFCWWQEERCQFGGRDTVR